MKYLFLLAFTLFLSCQYSQKDNNKLVLASKLEDDDIVEKSQLNFNLLSDSTYEFTIYEYQEFSHEKKETFRGQYLINDDTIFFDPFKFDYINSDKAIIKNSFIEFLNGDIPLKMKITKTTLPTKLFIDTLLYKDYAFFTFDSKFYRNFSPGDIPYDLKTSEIVKIDSIINSCIQKNSIGKSSDVKDYFKQCIAVKNNDSEIIVWVNLLCKGDSYEDLFYRVSSVSDGGECFFNLKINLSKENYYDLYINGKA